VLQPAGAKAVTQDLRAKVTLKPAAGGSTPYGQCQLKTITWREAASGNDGWERTLAAVLKRSSIQSTASIWETAREREGGGALAVMWGGCFGRCEALVAHTHVWNTCGVSEMGTGATAAACACVRAHSNLHINEQALRQRIFAH